jgi:6,7-dimethyl-8-ribityllumazine synthase
MSSNLKNLSEYNKDTIPSAQGMTFAIVVSEWNSEITDALLEGAYSTLIKNGALEGDITVKHVPGSFELSLGAQYVIEYANVDAVICLGCVIQGETRHFDFICNSVSKGITDVNLYYNTPVIFGVLTTNDKQQAKDRSGGKYGNKGVEAAISAIKMIRLGDELTENKFI